MSGLLTRPTRDDSHVAYRTAGKTRRGTEGGSGRSRN